MNRNYRQMEATMRFLVLLIVVLAATSAHADNTVTVGQIVNPWLQWVTGFALAIISGVLVVGLALLNKRAGIENNASVLAAEKHATDILDAGLHDAAGRVVISLGAKLDKEVLLPGHPEVAAAVAQMSQSALEAAEGLGVTPQDVAQMVVNKVGALTASNPSSFPSTNVSNLPGG